MVAVQNLDRYVRQLVQRAEHRFVMIRRLWIMCDDRYDRTYMAGAELPQMQVRYAIIASFEDLPDFRASLFARQRIEQNGRSGSHQSDRP